jgi:TonB family protein
MSNLIGRRTNLLLFLAASVAAGLPPTLLTAQAGQSGSTPKPMYVCSGAHAQPCAESPRPTYTPQPVYPQQARKQALSATVVLEVVITEEGKTANIKVAKPAGHGFDEAAVESVRRWTFDPGTYRGKQVPVIVDLKINFEPH